MKAPRVSQDGTRVIVAASLDGTERLLLTFDLQAGESFIGDFGAALDALQHEIAARRDDEALQRRGVQ